MNLHSLQSFGSPKYYGTIRNRRNSVRTSKLKRTDPSYGCLKTEWDTGSVTSRGHYRRPRRRWLEAVRSRLTEAFHAPTSSFCSIEVKEDQVFYVLRIVFCVSITYAFLLLLFRQRMESCLEMNRSNEKMKIKNQEILSRHELENIQWLYVIDGTFGNFINFH